MIAAATQVLGWLTCEYERAAKSRGSALVAESWNPTGPVILGELPLRCTREGPHHGFLRPDGAVHQHDADRSPDRSHTQLLIDTSASIMAKQGVRVDQFRAVDHPGWIGEAGPGPSYGDPLEDGTRAGIDSEFAQRNTTFMTWNLLHLARMLTTAGGFPAHGNQRSVWDAGARFDFPNPEYRS
jgi:hypothetical protein